MTSKRRISPTGLYHAVLKGHNDQWIFEDDEDRRHFLDELIVAKNECNVTIPSWCLMGNHVHLIVNDPDNHISDAICAACMHYAKDFNKEKGRSGPLFRHNYWREPIVTEAHLITAAHYIHFNPQVAGLSAANEYTWSSYRAYANEQTDAPLTSTELLGGLIGTGERFVTASLHYLPIATPFPGSALRDHLTYQEVKRLATKIVELGELLSLARMSPKERYPRIRKLIEFGFTDAEIESLTHIPHASIAYVRRSIR